jgi:hypothetical protein
MPLNTFGVPEGSATSQDTSTSSLLGVVTPPPAPPTAAPTLGTAPTVSATPSPLQGISTDAVGHLPVSVIAQALGSYGSDPVSPVAGQMWFRNDTKQFCICLNSTTIVRVTLA